MSGTDIRGTRDLQIYGELSWAKKEEKATWSEASGVTITSNWDRTFGLDDLFSSLNDSVILYLQRGQYDNLELQCRSMCTLLKLTFHLNWGAGSTFHISQKWDRQQCENIPLVQEPSKRKNRATRDGGTRKSSITKRNKCPAPASSPMGCQQLSQQG